MKVLRSASYLHAAGGVIGRRRRADAPETPIFFSNPDMVYQNEFPAPRLGQGAFAAAVQAVYEKARLPPSCVTRLWANSKSNVYIRS